MTDKEYAEWIFKMLKAKLEERTGKRISTPHTEDGTPKE